MAEHRHGRSRWLVILRCEHPPAEGPHPQCREIIPGDVLRAQWPCGQFEAFTPRAYTPAPRLESRHFLKFGCRLLQLLVQRVGKHSPSVLRSPFHATIVARTDPVKPAGVSNRQRAKHYRM